MWWFIFFILLYFAFRCYKTNRVWVCVKFENALFRWNLAILGLFMFVTGFFFYNCCPVRNSAAFSTTINQRLPYIYIYRERERENDASITWYNVFPHISKKPMRYFLQSPSANWGGLHRTSQLVWGAVPDFKIDVCNTSCIANLSRADLMKVKGPLRGI